MKLPSISKEYVVLGVGVTVSLLAGGAGGYIFAKRQLEAKYAEISEKEIAEAKNFYRVLYKKEEFATPESTVAHISREGETNVLIEEATDAMLTYQGGDPEAESEEDPVEVVREQLARRNIFTDAAPDAFDYETEVQSRSPDKPYVITQDEFLSTETDYNQTTLTYYEGDDVLADERDQTIDEIEMTVGSDNLQKFGFGSNDKNVVYIRNDRLELEFEVLKSTGKYTVEVLGFIEHSDRRGKIRRFRGDDE